MTKTIEIEVEGEVITAVLLEQKAPQTCKAIWDALPFDGTLNHAKMAGNELLYKIPVLIDDAENITFEHKAGNISYWPLRQCLVLLYEDLNSYEGTLVVAKVIDNLLGLQSVGRKCWIKQGVRMKVTRRAV